MKYLHKIDELSSETEPEPEDLPASAMLDAVFDFYLKGRQQVS